MKQPCANLGNEVSVSTAIIAALQFAVMACGPTTPTSLTQLPAGMWGGDHIRLIVVETGATIEFDCAHGMLGEAIALDRAGRFDVAGVFVREHGGPIRVDEVPDQEPARYAGTTDGRSMSLTVATSQPIGSFTLVSGQPGRLLKCL